MNILVLGPDEGWHANELRTAAENAGVCVSYATYESLYSRIDSVGTNRFGSLAGDLQSFDGVLTRTMPLGTLEQITFRLGILHDWYESGHLIVNPPRALEIAIDKHATTMRLNRLGLCTPRTMVCQSRADAMDAFATLGEHAVVKPMFGGEGRGVMLVATPELAWTTFTTLEHLGAVIYQQEFVPPGGRDLRLLVVGESLWALERSNSEDWRTNVSRGSRIRQVSLTNSMRETAAKICNSFDLRIAGIDLIFDADDQPLILEVNGVPGWKGAQSVIEENIAEQIIRTVQGSEMKYSASWKEE